MIDHIRDAMRRRDTDADAKDEAQEGIEPSELASEVATAPRQEDDAEHATSQATLPPATAEDDPLKPPADAVEAVRDLVFERVMELTGDPVAKRPAPARAEAERGAAHASGGAAEEADPEDSDFVGAEAASVLDRLDYAVDEETDDAAEAAATLRADGDGALTDHDALEDEDALADASQEGPAAETAIAARTSGEQEEIFDLATVSGGLTANDEAGTAEVIAARHAATTSDSDAVAAADGKEAALPLLPIDDEAALRRSITASTEETGETESAPSPSSVEGAESDAGSGRRSARRSNRRSRGFSRAAASGSSIGTKIKGAVTGVGGKVTGLATALPTWEFMVGAGGRGFQLRVEPPIQFGVAGVLVLLLAGALALPGGDDVVAEADQAVVAEAAPATPAEAVVVQPDETVIAAAVAQASAEESAERRALERRLATAKAELEALNTNLATERAALRDSERRAEMLNARMQEAATGLDEARVSIETLRGRLSEQADEIRTLRQTIRASAAAEREANAAAAAAAAAGNQQSAVAGVGFGTPSIPQAPIALASIAPDSFSRPTTSLSGPDAIARTPVTPRAAAPPTPRSPVSRPAAIGAASAPAPVAQPGATAPAQPGAVVPTPAAVVAVLDVANEAETAQAGDDAAAGDEFGVGSAVTRASTRKPDDGLASLRSQPGSILDNAATLQGDVYVQAGVFTAKSYGYRLHKNLTDKGIAADVLPTKFLGKDAIRVRAGPFETAEERRSAMAALRALGINDALPVSR
ncbi:MAG: SPOR domain-containing protein [Pseudomonadota bacterium]